MAKSCSNKGKGKINFDEESKTFLDSSSPKDTQAFEAKKELVDEMVSLLSGFRDNLPPASIRYNNAMTSIIVSLKAYISYEEMHTGIWNGFEHLCMAHTYYSYLVYCTQPKNPKRDSKVQLDLHNFLKEMNRLWLILLAQYLDYSSKH